MKSNVFMVIVALAGCGSDDAKTVESDINVSSDAANDSQSDAGRDVTVDADVSSDMSDDATDMAPHVSLIGISERTTCKNLCADEGKECAAYQHVLFGLIYGEAEYGLTGGAALRCDQFPDATMNDPVNGGTLEFNGMMCGCQ